MATLFIRGTVGWERQELDRRANGCRCISSGTIPHDQVMRSVPINDVRRMPSKARLAWLHEEQRRRLEGEVSQLEDKEMAA
jgi:hypothetical protein